MFVQNVNEEPYPPQTTNQIYINGGFGMHYIIYGHIYSNSYGRHIYSNFRGGKKKFYLPI